MNQDDQMAAQNPAVPDEPWENCKGQCGCTPWCRDCLLQKKKKHEEKLNREGLSDDNKE